MKKVKSIKIEEFEKGVPQNSPSKITLKSSKSGRKRKLTIQNDGGTWTKPKEKRLSIIIRDNLFTDKPEVTIELRNGKIAEMTFLDLCDIADIMRHHKDLGMNLMCETRVIDDK